MRRKIIQQSATSMGISLPSKWIKKQNLRKGDEIDVIEEPTGTLSIKTKEIKPTVINKASLDVEGMDRHELSRAIRALYHQRIDEITLTFNTKKISLLKEKKELGLVEACQQICNSLIGLEITKEEQNQIILQCFVSKEDTEKIENVERRIFLLIKDFMNNLLENIDNFSNFHKRVWQIHDNIAKFCDFYLRIVTYSSLSIENKTAHYSLMFRMDNIVNQLRYLSDAIFRVGTITPKAKNYLKEFFSLFNTHYKFLYSIDNIDIKEVVKERYKLIRKTKQDNFTSKEYRIIGELLFMFHISNDFYNTKKINEIEF
ncbi:MAG: AbrB/MazE/SpoVT family DNA-binding domain-containing protein [Nanoarchaeota archaeon]|nr:AbrB/MazE/SpoVT family DNA-binding domain-containing protein [Nanoarchaeota archaeon]